MLSCAVLSSLEVYSAPPVNIRNVFFPVINELK